MNVDACDVLKCLTILHSLLHTPRCRFKVNHVIELCNLECPDYCDECHDSNGDDVTECTECHEGFYKVGDECYRK